MAIAPKGVVEDGAKATFETAWATEVVKLFQELTGHWEDTQRSSFWQRLRYPGVCPPKPPPPPPAPEVPPEATPTPAPPAQTEE